MKQGPRPAHVDATSRSRRERYFFDYVKDELIKEYGAKTVRRAACASTRRSTSRSSRQAREAISGRLAGIGPSSAIVTIDPKNGYIMAMASSADYGKSKFNLAAQGHRQPGSSFKVMALMTALRKGVDPNSHDATSSKLADEFDDPTCGPDRRQDLRRHERAASISLDQATLHSDNSVYVQLALDLGPDKVKQTALRHGHQVASSTATGRVARRPRERRLAARDGRRLRDDRLRRLPQPADARSPRSPSRDGTVRAAARAGASQRTKAFSDGVTDEATRDPRGEHPGRHRHARANRLPGGRQDRHDRQEHRRVVRRLHAAAGDRRVGRLPQRADLDERPSTTAARRRRHVPGRDLGRLHEEGQGQVLRRLHAAQGAVPRQPFFGKYARSGGKGTGERRPAERRLAVRLADDADRRRDADDAGRHRQEAGHGNGNGNGNDKGKFDPDLYESPPQGAPTDRRQPRPAATARTAATAAPTG